MASKPATLTDSSSLLLDVIRLSAALLVVVAHLSRREFAVVLGHNLQFLGDLAVPVFFVLSGFVIRFVTVSREHTLRLYLVDRASRIYSVALPALACTIAVSAFVLRAAPAYASEFLTPLMNHAAVRVMANLTFLSQIWGLNTVQFGDSPFWSLSYECLFYIAYGFLFYLRGGRRIAAIVLWMVVAGPPILMLFPLWLLGCGLHDLYQYVRERAAAAIVRKLAWAYVGVATGLALWGRDGLWLAPLRLDQAIASLPSPLGFIHMASMRATMLALANGTLAAVAMFLLLLLSDLVPLRRSHPLARRFRRLADGTFAIYLMHYPLMMLARSLHLLRPDAPLLDALIVTTIVSLLIAISAPLDRFKSLLRTLLNSAFGEAMKAPRAPASQPVHPLQEGVPSS